MTTHVTVRDELAISIGRPPTEFILALPTDQISIRDFIRARVEQEVSIYNAKRTGFFHGLIQPTDAEQTLNGFILRKQRAVDLDTQMQKALDAFERNGFLMLVNDQQVERLDDMIVLRPETVVTFLKLVPLVGG